jgi:hypothetical protein
VQLGTRWRVGAEAPERLSEEFVARIRHVEAQLVGIDTSQWRWTLTWLEGRPVAELDDGTVVRLRSSGEITIESLD